MRTLLMGKSAAVNMTPKTIGLVETYIKPDK